MNDYDIKKLYEEMEQEIISSMKRNYKRHLNEESKTGFKYSQWQAEKLKELKRYQRENKNIIGEYTNSLSDEISKHMQDELRQGSINAIKQYNKVLKQNLKPSEVMNKSFFQINDKKVNALIKSVNDDLKTANTAILRMTNDQYRQVIHKSAFFVGNGVFTEQQASRMAVKKLTELQLTKLAIDESNKDFLSRGLACIEYKDGRRVNVSSYAQMAVRTANLRAQLMGEGDFRKSIGRTLVISTSHGGACPICQKWENKVFIDDVYSGGTKKDGNYMLLSDAMKQGFLHPNCRHGLTTYYPELEGIENETEEEYQADIDYINERINYIERNIKKYDRLKSGSIAPTNIQLFGKKKRQWEKEKLNAITEEEAIALRNYTGIDSQKINSALRRGQISDEIKNKINLLDSVIQKAPTLTEDIEVYRGTIPQSLELFKNSKKVSNEEMLALKGTIQQDMAFMSTSSKTAETVGRNVIMKIHLPKGYKGALFIKKYALPKFKYQEEVLLKRGNSFMIKNVTIKENKYYLDVEMLLDE